MSKLAVLIPTFFFAFSVASSAQTLEEVRSQVKSQISDYYGQSDTLVERAEKALAVVQNTSNCYWEELEHIGPTECSASIELTELAEDDFELRLATSSPVNSGQCVRIGGFLKTQYDIDNNIPLIEDVWFLSSNSEVFTLQKSDFNGRKPVQVDKKITCKLSIDPTAAYCEVSAGLLSDIGSVLDTTEPGLAEYKQVISYVRENPSAVPWDANSVLAIWQGGQDAFIEINSNLTSTRDKLNKARDIHCNQ